VHRSCPLFVATGHLWQLQVPVSLFEDAAVDMLAAKNIFHGGGASMVYVVLTTCAWMGQACCVRSGISKCNCGNPSVACFWVRSYYGSARLTQVARMVPVPVHQVPYGSTLRHETESRNPRRLFRCYQLQPVGRLVDSAAATHCNPVAGSWCWCW
jgi:hypothetical protein